MNEKDRLDQISRRIIGAAIEVHKTVGSGLLESAYQACLVFELRQQGFNVEAQKPLAVVYKDVHLDCGSRLALVVEDALIFPRLQHRSKENSRDWCPTRSRAVAPGR